MENYFPKKKDRDIKKLSYMNNIEAETIKKFSKLDPKNYKTLFPTKKL